MFLNIFILLNVFKYFYFIKCFLGSLKELAKVHPELLYQKLQKCKMNFKNQMGIEILIEHCQCILRNK